MSSFSVSALEKKISELTNSQQSIQTLSLWCIHHRKHAKTICQTWIQEMKKEAKPKKKLTMIYLANDILQTCRKKGPEYAKEFNAVLPSAFRHCAKECDEKTMESVRRIVGIWLERQVYGSDNIAKFKKNLIPSFKDVAPKSPKLEKDVGPRSPKTTPLSRESRRRSWDSSLITTTPPGSPPPEKKSKLDGMIKPKHTPDADELVAKLQDLENSATQDAVVREKIANLPNEVTDPTYIDKVQDLKSARQLQQSIDEACGILAEYNARLAAEQVDRHKAQKMLMEYIEVQRYQQALMETRLEEYQSKLEQVTNVREELRTHLNNLPDIMKLPDPIPLPSAGDLFGRV